MSLGNLTENIYNGNASLDAAKQEQRKMENKILLVTIRLRMCINYYSFKCKGVLQRKKRSSH